MALIILHVLLALALFLLINWIGEHAGEFGYASATLFSEPNDSVAFNFLIRSLAPAVFVITLSAIFVAVGHPGLRLGIYAVATYYYLMRLGFIFVFNMHRLVSWPRFLLNSTAGIIMTWFAYHHLIVPNRSLLPDLNAAGNELWLAILAFLYAAANNVKVSTAAGDRRRNSFMKHQFEDIQRKYAHILAHRTSDPLLLLLIYSVIIYENYCRPPAIRTLENLMFWRTQKTTGVMQVSASKVLKDHESVNLGVNILTDSWEANKSLDVSQRIQVVIATFNKDDRYVDHIFDVMRMLAKRAAPQFENAYDGIWRSTASSGE